MAIEINKGAASSAPTNNDSNHRFNLRWASHLRWAAVSGQVIVIALCNLFFRIHLDLTGLLPVLAAETIFNIAVWHRLHRHAPVTQRWVVGSLIFDTFAISTLLFYTGGARNPFSILYLLHVVLPALTLPRKQAIFLASFALLCEAFLFSVYIPLPALEIRLFAVAGFGSAVFVSAITLFYFVQKVTHEHAILQKSLQTAQAQAVLDEHIAALATLAAGAAHELSTPLSTIAIVTGEIQHRIVQEEPTSPLLEDIALIRSEVNRCRTVLQRMHPTHGMQGIDPHERVTLTELIDHCLREFSHANRVHVEHQNPHATLVVPRLAMAQALRAIVHNGLMASSPEQHVKISTEISENMIYVHIHDQGHGMPDHIAKRATEPFFTTKDPGEGTGLGLFLARAIIARLGGQITIHSQESVGTTVTVMIPMEKN